MQRRRSIRAALRREFETICPSHRRPLESPMKRNIVVARVFWQSSPRAPCPACGVVMNE
jgi:hypothetical protein